MLSVKPVGFPLCPGTSSMKRLGRRLPPDVSGNSAEAVVSNEAPVVLVSACNSVSAVTETDSCAVPISRVKLRLVTLAAVTRTFSRISVLIPGWITSTRYVPPGNAARL